MLDCIIVGGGPAGLSAALVLGRCRRSVLVCDAGRPRNGRSASMHGFLTRDGVPPLDFLVIARVQLGAYPNVRLRPVEATHAEHRGDSFGVQLATGEELASRTLVLATGVVDAELLD